MNAKIGLRALVRAEQRDNTGCPGTAAARFAAMRESDNQLFGELQPDRRLVTGLACRSTIWMRYWGKGSAAISEGEGK